LTLVISRNCRRHVEDENKRLVATTSVVNDDVNGDKVSYDKYDVTYRPACVQRMYEPFVVQCMEPF
jgi:hypothetical protein